LELAAADCYRYRRPVTLEAIRSHAGVSVGTLYHHFPNGLDELLGGLYLDTRIPCERAVFNELARHRSLERGVEAAVGSHLQWMARCPSRAFLLLHFNPGWLDEERRTTLASAADELELDADEWYRAHVRSGAARPLAHQAYWAVIFGPPRSYARRLFARADPTGDLTALVEATSTLASAAWLAVGCA